jgi:F0F1-type ATP synthase assembly protein I
MPSDESDSDRAAKPVNPIQERMDSAAPAAAASYTLIGAVLGLGAIGYGFDRWQGTAPWGLVTGLLLGMVVGFYELIKSARR